MSKQVESQKRPAKQLDEQFCHSCGNVVKREAVICVHCGVALSGQAGAYSAAVRPVVPMPKDKTVAVLLAVFLSFFTWLYTYKKDAWKFWTNFGLNFVFWWTVVMPLASWIWSIIDVAVKDETFYRDFPS